MGIIGIKINNIIKVSYEKPNVKKDVHIAVTQKAM